MSAKSAIKSVIASAPFQSLYRMIRPVGLPRRVFQHLPSRGPFRATTLGKPFQMISYGHALENNLFWAGTAGTHEPVSLEIWARAATQAKVIFDVGANTGVYSLIAKTVNPAAKVIAFEPIPRIFEKLERNVALNDMDVQCEPRALSSATGEAIIHDDGSDHNYGASLEKSSGAGWARMVESKIKTVRGDEFMRDNALDHIDLIKIDVERHEPDVLRGFGDVIVRCQPTMLIEILDDDVAAAVQTLVEDAGYLVFDIDEHRGPRKMARLCGSSTYNFLLCSKDTANRLGLPCSNQN